MKNNRKILIVIMIMICLIGTNSIYAASPSKGMKGIEGEILSKVTTYAGSSEFNYVDGTAAEAAFRFPHRLAVTADNKVFVSDSRNHTIRLISNEEVTTYAGFTLELNEFGLPLGGYADGEKELSVFDHPGGLSVDASGQVYIADTNNHVIRKIDLLGNVTTLAGSGFIGDADGMGAAAAFYHPEDVVVTSSGIIYVADTLNHVVRRILPDGSVTTLNALSDRAVQVAPGVVEAAGDYLDGALEDAKFNEPSALALDSKGNLYVSDTGNQLIRYIDFSTQRVTTVAGYVDEEFVYETDALYALSGYVDGPEREARFFSPKGIAITGEGGLLIADSLNHTIRYLYEGQVITLAGDPSETQGNTNGINGFNQLHLPVDVAVLSDGSFIIADSYNHLIRQFDLYRLPSHLPVNQEVKVVFGTEVIYFDAQPEIVNGRTMVPVRALTEDMGYQVDYDAITRSAHLIRDNIKLELFVGKEEIHITLEGTAPVVKSIDIAPYIKDGRMYVPIRFFSEEFGLDVQWNQDNKTVIVREPLF